MPLPATSSFLFDVPGIEGLGVLSDLKGQATQCLWPVSEDGSGIGAVLFWRRSVTG